jgi:ATP adenylyltransferase
MAYIDQPLQNKDRSAKTCVFCVKAAQTDDLANLIVHRGKSAYVLLNLYPYNNGHLLVAPYHHTALLNEIDEECSQEIMALTRRSQAVLETVYQPQGYNIGMNLGTAAGAGIADHLHLHIVPRWNGDTNFMPVLSETKVLPDSLEHSARLLRDAW